MQIDVGDFINRQVDLNCSASGSGAGNMFTWFRDGIMISDGVDFQITNMEEGSSLVISNLMSGVDDVFTCSVENPAGSGNTSVTINGKLIIVSNYVEIG